MAAVSIDHAQLHSTLQTCVTTLRKLAEYEVDPLLEQRLHQLGERKEFLSQAEQEELLALVDFVQKRTIEKLEARVALESLQRTFPDALVNV
jgi:hypothetical protein